jgi:Lipocalin-like domain
MSKGHFLSLSVVAVLGLSTLSGSAIAQHKTLKEQLIGTWTPVSWQQDVTGGQKLQRFGADPKGITVFERNGRFIQIFMRPDLPKIASNNLSSPTPDEAKAIVAGSIAYYGTYSVDEAAKTIAYHIEASTFANQLGIDQKRKITSISPSEMTYINTTVVGNTGQITITMKRIK